MYQDGQQIACPGVRTSDLHSENEASRRSFVSRFSASMSARRSNGAIAQLGEHLLCKQGVVGSIPISSTNRYRT